MRPSRFIAIFGVVLLSTLTAQSKTPSMPSSSAAAISSDLSLDGSHWALTHFSPGDGEKTTPMPRPSPILPSSTP